MRKVLTITAVFALILVSASVGAVLLNRSGETSMDRADHLTLDQHEDRLGQMRAEFAPSASTRSKAVQSGADSDESLASTTPQVDTLPPIGNKVIKTAEVSVEVEEGTFQEKFAAAGRIAEELGGYVTSSSSSEFDGTVSSGSIVLRVPSEKFQAALAALKGLGEVTSEASGGQDVTGEFVDLEARLRHLKSQEAFYLKLMNEAETVADMIQVQSQLSSIQLQIEQHTGRLEQLKDQTSFATITARVFEPGAAFGRDPRGLAEAWEQAVVNFERVIGGLVMAAGWLAPLGLIALAAFGIWKARRPKLA